MPETASAYPTAPLALILCVPMVFALFSSFSPARAAFLSILVGTLVLPAGYGWEVRGFTFLDKATIPLLSVTAACLVTAPREFRHLRLRGASLALVAALAISPMLTAYTNSDAYTVGGFNLPGLTPWDGFGLVRGWFFGLLLPFLLGRMLVRDVRQIEHLLRPLVVGFLAYSLLMLWEIRMSPQLHNLVYGYFPHAFSQQVRSGGFRPVVFIGHGLGLAILTAFAALGSVMLWRRGRKIRGLPAALVTSYLGVVIALCKTLSAFLYFVTGGVLMFLGSTKTQVRAATAIACIVLAYPMLRSFDLFPTSLLVQLSGSASAERSDSLAFRFENEDLLLAHARERLWFGWGGYGRNRVFDEEGSDISVTDGLWIIMLGEIGAVGFASAFGLMLLPIFQVRRALRNLDSESDRRLLASMALLVALNWADSLPNSLSGGQLMLFVTGAFAGVVASYQTPAPLRKEREKPPVPAAVRFGSPAALR